MKLARRLASAGAAVLLPAVQPVMLGGAVATLVSASMQQPAAAENAESVAKVAQAITVRIEGATQGSGVLVKREGNRYTVLTAWHVVGGQRPGEELAVFTSDGRPHSVDGRNIRQIDGTDLASLTFASEEDYATARAGSVRDIKIGSRLYVGGFPLPTTAVPSRLFRFLEGRSIASTTHNSTSGYGLLYSNPTLPGMSGGPVLDETGLLVGVHGRAETDSLMTEQQGVAVKTGSNQGMPIGLYMKTSDRQEKRQAASTERSQEVTAQQQQPRRNPPKENSTSPANSSDMNLYTRIAAVNVCIARGAGVPFDKASGIAGETIAQLIKGMHGSEITQVVPLALSIDDLRKGSINSAVLGAAEICPKELPVDVLKKVEAAAGTVLRPWLSPKSPASESDMNLYTRIAAVNVCIARGGGVPFDKAVGIAGETITQVIQGRHESEITQVGASALSLGDLRKGSINSAVLGAAEICPREVPADVMAKVQAALR